MNNTAAWHDRCGLDAVLRRFPRLDIRPNGTPGLRLLGALAFKTEDAPGVPSIEDSYEVEILVPREFPELLPLAFERGGRIPQEYHKYGSGELCLGAPLRLILILRSEPTLLRFIERCLVPYLYRRSHLERYGRAPWGELEHGAPGILQDYERLFATTDKETTLGFLKLVSLKKRVANKRPCPCGSGRRLGRCHNRRVNRVRQVRQLYQAEMAARRARMAARPSEVGAKESLAVAAPLDPAATQVDR